MDGDTFTTIVQPLHDIIEKFDGVADLQIFHTEDNHLVLRAVCNTTPSILKIATNLRCGHTCWDVSILGTDTPSHILVRGVLDLEGWKWEDVKREVDYKVCLLKM